MLQNMVLQTKLKQQEQPALLSLNLKPAADLFPGFALGDFAVIHSSQSCVSLTSLLCVKAQLENSLNSSVIFIDGGNTYNPAYITRLAKIHHVDPDKALKRINVQKVSSAYQLTMFIMEYLKESVQKFNAKLVVISDIARLFLDENIPEEEARGVFSQVTSYLQNFAKENKVVVIATYFSRPNSNRNFLLRTLACLKANVVIGLRQTQYEHNLELEKHPKCMLGSAEFAVDRPSLLDFI